MADYKFSIVVPVYQAETFLKECIESVLQQEENLWELILVDDGSTDKSPVICDNYAACYSQIRVIHKKNEGPILTRYRGFCLAQGEYILNLDADDRLNPSALNILAGTLEQEPCDMVIFNYCRIDSKGNQTGKKSKLTKNRYGKNDKEILFQKLLEEEILNLLWNKVFKRKYIKNILSQDKKLYSIVNGDDAVLIMPVLVKAENIVAIENVLYEYRIAPNSITMRFELRKAKEFFTVRTYMLKILQQERLWTPMVEKEFYKMIYQIAAYLLWNCARSKEHLEVKIKFYKFVKNQQLYKNSLQYTHQVKFPKRKKLSLWIFERQMYIFFTVYEKLQNVLSVLKKQLRNR